MKRTMLQACLFDMGNVVLPFSHERMCRQMGDVCGTPAGTMREIIMDSGLQAEFECGLPWRDYQRRIEQAVGRTVDGDRLCEAHCDIFEPSDSVAAIIAELRAGGVRLVLLSNTDEAHFDFIRRRYPVFECFDAFVLSCRVGAMKPADAIFRAALDTIGCPPGGCFYTDDIPSYVEAARRWGLLAEVFIDAASLRAHLARLGL